MAADMPPACPTRLGTTPYKPTPRLPRHARGPGGKPSCANAYCGFCTATCPPTSSWATGWTGLAAFTSSSRCWRALAPRARPAAPGYCLTCRNCEGHLPSGVQYGHLVDMAASSWMPRCRARSASAARWALQGASTPVVRSAMRLGQAVRGGALPDAVRAKGACAAPRRAFRSACARSVLLLAAACSHPLMARIHDATVRAGRYGHNRRGGARARCCGAVRFHLNDQEGALAQMPRQHRRLVAAGRRRAEGGRSGPL